MYIIFIHNSFICIYIIHIRLTDQARLPKAASLECTITGNWSDIWKAASLKRVRWNRAWHLFSHGMVSIRPATIDDLPGMQACSLTILGRSVGDIATDVWKQIGHGRCVCVCFHGLGMKRDVSICTKSGLCCIWRLASTLSAMKHGAAELHLAAP